MESRCGGVRPRCASVAACGERLPFRSAGIRLRHCEKSVPGDEGRLSEAIEVAGGALLFMPGACLVAMGALASTRSEPS
jgi:hypothetical protein